MSASRLHAQTRRRSRIYRRTPSRGRALAAVFHRTTVTPAAARLPPTRARPRTQARHRSHRARIRTLHSPLSPEAVAFHIETDRPERQHALRIRAPHHDVYRFAVARLRDGRKSPISEPAPYFATTRKEPVPQHAWSQTTPLFPWHAHLPKSVIFRQAAALERSLRSSAFPSGPLLFSPLSLRKAIARKARWGRKVGPLD